MPHMRRIGSDMMQYLIMCRSMTYAQRSAALLERSGISAKVVKAPQGPEQQRLRVRGVAVPTL